MNVIIISGKQGSGKTTLQKALSQLITSKTGEFVQTVKFADVIYKIHDYALNVLKQYGIERDIKKDGRLLQLLGTEWGRGTIDDDIWCQIAKNKIKKLEERGFKYCIIDDCRFENEFDSFPEALRIRLDCPREIRMQRCEMWRPDGGHASEKGLDFYADDMRFDLYLGTAGDMTPERHAEIVFENLRYNKTRELRKEKARI